MKAQYSNKTGSVTAIIGLMLMAATITVSGLGFGVYSIINNVSFTVLRAQIPGFIFAAVVAFLGARYLFSTIKLAKRIKGEKFCWNNFRKTANENGR